MELGDHVQMQYSRYSVVRQKHNWGYGFNGYGDYRPGWGANTQTKVIYYFNTEGLPNQAEIELGFATEAWTEYRRY